MSKRTGLGGMSGSQSTSSTVLRLRVHCSRICLQDAETTPPFKSGWTCLWNGDAKPEPSRSRSTCPLTPVGRRSLPARADLNLYYSDKPRENRGHRDLSSLHEHPDLVRMERFSTDCAALRRCGIDHEKEYKSADTTAGDSIVALDIS
jgi:hypothetical protein